MNAPFWTSNDDILPPGPIDVPEVIGQEAGGSFDRYATTMSDMNANCANLKPASTMLVTQGMPEGTSVVQASNGQCVAGPRG